MILREAPLVFNLVDEYVRAQSQYENILGGSSSSVTIPVCEWKKKWKKSVEHFRSYLSQGSEMRSFDAHLFHDSWECIPLHNYRETCTDYIPYS